MKRVLHIGLVIGVLLLLSACAAGPNTALGTAGTDGVSSFWDGLWHGAIAGITLLISLFNQNVSFYDVHNNGNFYNVGFVLGGLVNAFFVGTVSAAGVAART